MMCLCLSNTSTSLWPFGLFGQFCSSVVVINNALTLSFIQSWSHPSFRLERFRTSAATHWLNWILLWGWFRRWIHHRLHCSTEFSTQLDCWMVPERFWYGNIPPRLDRWQFLLVFFSIILFVYRSFGQLNSIVAKWIAKSHDTEMGGWRVLLLCCGWHYGWKAKRPSNPYWDHS